MKLVQLLELVFADVMIIIRVEGTIYATQRQFIERKTENDKHEDKHREIKSDDHKCQGNETNYTVSGKIHANK